MKKRKKFSNWFETKPVTSFFAIIAAIGGFLFLSYRPTGGVILNEQSSFNILSIIGSLLILCAIILGIYSIRKK